MRRPASKAHQLQANAIAAAIEEGLNRVRAVTPEQVADQIGQASIVFNLIIIGASVIAPMTMPRMVSAVRSGRRQMLLMASLMECIAC